MPKRNRFKRLSWCCNLGTSDSNTEDSGPKNEKNAEHIAQCPACQQEAKKRRRKLFFLFCRRGGCEKCDHDLAVAAEAATVSENGEFGIPEADTFGFQPSGVKMGLSSLQLPLSAVIDFEKYKIKLPPPNSSPVDLKVDPVSSKDVGDKISSVEETPPEFITKPKRRFVNEGESAKFKASFEGPPQTVLIWSLNGKDVIKDNRHKIFTDRDYHILEIPEVTIDDQGTYMCTIKNSAGSASASAELEVYVPLKPRTSEPLFLAPTVDIPLEDIEFAYKERHATLECKFHYGFDATAKWYKDGQEVELWDAIQLFNGRTAKLTFPVAAKRIPGVYECIVTNSGGEAKTQGLVSLLDPKIKREAPKFIVPLVDQSLEFGEKLVLETEVTGRPRPSLKWYKDDIQLGPSQDIRMEYKNGKGRLIVDNMAANDVSKITCLAKNVAGEAQTTAAVTVTADDKTGPEIEDPVVTESENESPEDHSSADEEPKKFGFLGPFPVDKERREQLAAASRKPNTVLQDPEMTCPKSYIPVLSKRKGLPLDASKPARIYRPGVVDDHMGKQNRVSALQIMYKSSKWKELRMSKEFRAPYSLYNPSRIERKHLPYFVEEQLKRVFIPPTEEAAALSKKIDSQKTPAPELPAISADASTLPSLFSMPELKYSGKYKPQNQLSFDEIIWRSETTEGSDRKSFELRPVPVSRKEVSLKLSTESKKSSSDTIKSKNKKYEVTWNTMESDSSIESEDTCPDCAAELSTDLGKPMDTALYNHKVTSSSVSRKKRSRIPVMVKRKQSKQGLLTQAETHRVTRGNFKEPSGNCNAPKLSASYETCCLKTDPSNDTQDTEPFAALEKLPMVRKRSKIPRFQNSKLLKRKQTEFKPAELSESGNLDKAVDVKRSSKLSEPRAEPEIQSLSSETESTCSEGKEANTSENSVNSAYLSELQPELKSALGHNSKLPKLKTSLEPRTEDHAVSEDSFQGSYQTEGTIMYAKGAANDLPAPKETAAQQTSESKHNVNTKQKSRNIVKKFVDDFNAMFTKEVDDKEFKYKKIKTPIVLHISQGVQTKLRNTFKKVKNKNEAAVEALEEKHTKQVIDNDTDKTMLAEDKFEADKVKVTKSQSGQNSVSEKPSVLSWYNDMIGNTGDLYANTDIEAQTFRFGVGLFQASAKYFSQKLKGGNKQEPPDKKLEKIIKETSHADINKKKSNVEEMINNKTPKKDVTTHIEQTMNNNRQDFEEVINNNKEESSESEEEEEEVLGACGVTPEPRAEEQIMELGFSRKAACHALKVNDHDINKAAEWLFNGEEDVDRWREEPQKQEPGKQEPPKEGSRKQEPPKQEPPKEKPPKQKSRKEEKQEPPKEKPPKQKSRKEEKLEPPKEESPKEDPPSPRKEYVKELDQCDIEVLVELGFTKDQAITALKVNEKDTGKAADWLFTGTSTDARKKQRQEKQQKLMARKIKIKQVPIGPKEAHARLSKHEAIDLIPGHIKEIYDILKVKPISQEEYNRELKEAMNEVEPVTPAQSDVCVLADEYPEQVNSVGAFFSCLDNVSQAPVVPHHDRRKRRTSGDGAEIETDDSAEAEAANDDHVTDQTLVVEKPADGCAKKTGTRGKKQSPRSGAGACSIM